jgi:hypothetical protein
MDRMYQMQSSTQNYVEQLAVAMDAMRSSYDRLRTLRPGAESGTGPASDLPPQVRRLFDDAHASLDELDQVEALVGDAFATRGEGGLIAKRTLLRRLRRDTYQPIGIALLIRHMATVFRTQVGAWYETLRAPSPSGGEISQLRALCATYDSICEHLPMIQLNALSRTSAGYGSRQTGHPDIREAFDRLGARVQAAMLDSLDSPT